MRAHVDGSGTGVKFRNRLFPTSLTPNVPPLVLLVKPDVTRLNWSGLNPVIVVGEDANIQEKGVAALKFMALAAPPLLLVETTLNVIVLFDAERLRPPDALMRLKPVPADPVAL
jgi:hypothetical protein